jgi:hypothetical protein
VKIFLIKRKDDLMSYNKIQDNFWIDEKVRGWDFKTRMTALYLLNNQHRFSEGLYHLPLSYIVEDTKLTKKEIDKALKKLCSDNFIKYDRVNSIVLIINALKYQPLQNINHCKAALKKLEQLPKSPLLKELIEKAKLYNPKFYQLLKKKSQNIKFLQIAFQEISNNDLNLTQTKGLSLDLNKGLKREQKDSQAQTPTPVPILTQTQTLDKKAEIIFKDNQNPELKKLEKMTCYLIELIENNNPRAPLPAKDPADSRFKKWLKELEKLHRLGPVGANANEKKGYSFQEIEAIINFSQQDQFWKNNILSARALRKQIIKLENKMKSSKYSQSNQKTDMLKNLYLAAKEEEDNNGKN